MAILVLLIVAFIVNFSVKQNPNSQNTPTNVTTVDSNQADIVYKDDMFGFQLTLPKTWSGYKLERGEIPFGNSVTLVHPDATELKPRMNIPIYVYPIEKWTEWEKNNFEGYPTAAPIGPTERGRNSKFVFATAPRYNFSYLPGFEEVEEIIKTLKVN